MDIDPIPHMKTKSLAFLVLLAISRPARSEEPPIPGTNITTARVLGDIPDGTPAPTISVPEFIVPAKDILETTTHELDGRTIHPAHQTHRPTSASRKCTCARQHRTSPK
jgi:hypothetical protein